MALSSAISGEDIIFVFHRLEAVERINQQAQRQPVPAVAVGSSPFTAAPMGNALVPPVFGAGYGVDAAEAAAAAQVLPTQRGRHA